MERDELTCGEITNGIGLVEVSVVLVAEGNDPSIINRDFLDRLEILVGEWKVVQPTFSTPMFSQVTFSEGLSVASAPSVVMFSQSASSLNVDDVVIPDVATRYMAAVPNVCYSGYTINLTGFVPSAGDNPANMVHTLADKGESIAFSGVVPEVHLRSTYRFDDRIIVLEVEESVMETGGSGTLGVLFQGSIEHRFPSVDEPEFAEFVKSALGNWRRQVEEFNDLVHRIYSNYLLAGEGA